MPHEITVTEIRSIPIAEITATSSSTERIERLKMTIDGELDIPTVIKAITTGKRKRKGKVSA